MQAFEAREEFTRAGDLYAAAGQPAQAAGLYLKVRLTDPTASGNHDTSLNVGS